MFCCVTVHESFCVPSESIYLLNEKNIICVQKVMDSMCFYGVMI